MPCYQSLGRNSVLQVSAAQRTDGCGRVGCEEPEEWEVAQHAQVGDLGRGGREDACQRQLVPEPEHQVQQQRRLHATRRC